MTRKGRTTSTTASSFFAGFATTASFTMPRTPMVVGGRQKFTKKRLQVKTFHPFSFPVFVVFLVRLFRVAAAVVILTFRDGCAVVINNGVPPSENSLISCETARNLIM